MQHTRILALFFVLVFCFVFIRCSSGTAKSNAGKKDTTGLTKDFKFTGLSAAKAAAYTNAIDEFYQKRLVRTGFNGAILVAKNGQVLFEQYRGYGNFITKDSVTPHTPFHIASTSKTFTGMAVLKLWENGSSQRLAQLFIFYG